MEKIPVVDSHFHMWDLARFRYKWPSEKQNRIFQNFLPENYAKERKGSGIDYSVFVEVAETTEETRWALELANHNPFIKGVVGYVNLSSSQVESEICEFKRNPKFVGARKILDLCEKGWLERHDVMNGMQALARHNLTFDLLVKTRDEFDTTKRFLAKAPANLKMVLDHLGKPDAVQGAGQAWYDDIAAMATHPNLYCKLSGMVTEADPVNWKARDFKLHVDHVINCFGFDRVMFGSDWPVCKMAGADLKDVKKLLEELLCSATENDKAKVFGGNAARFYGLQL